MKPQTTRRLWIFGPLILGLTLCYLDALTEARGVLGVARFHAGYRLAGSKSQWLRTYRAGLWKYDGGYVPFPVQQFLCSRLEDPVSDSEVQAIADFYASQARGRETGPLDSLSLPAKTRFIEALFGHVPSQARNERMRTLFLVEEVRRGKMIGKGYFFSSNTKLLATHLRVHPVHRKNSEVEEVAEEILLKWWNSKLPAREKLLQNPLKNVVIKIDSY